jgi:hypothetical protein
MCRPNATCGCWHEGRPSTAIEDRKITVKHRPTRFLWLAYVPGIEVQAMDDSSIASHTEKLRREIALIPEQERIYRNRKGHSFADKAEHEKRESRLVAIRDELKKLVEKETSHLSHGLVSYS